MYNPTIGRWMTEDPEGFEAADENLFRYVHNDTPNLIDPSGLEEIRKLPVAPGDVGIVLDSDPKEVGKVHGGVVSYALGKLGVDKQAGVYIQYKGPDAGSVYFIQFLSLKAYIDKKGKIKNLPALPDFSDPRDKEVSVKMGLYRDTRSANPSVKNGITIDYKGGQVTRYVDSHHPLGLAGVAMKPKPGQRSVSADLGGFKNGVAWEFDGPNIPRLLSIAYTDMINKPGGIKLEKDERLRFEMAFTTLVVLNKKKEFQVLGSVTWSAFSDVFWFEKPGFQGGWAPLKLSVKYSGFQAGVPKDLAQFQRVYQDNLKAQGNTEGYSLTK